MNNREFMKFVAEQVQTARGESLPEDGKGASYNSSYSCVDKTTRELTTGIQSSVCEGPAMIEWGVEIAVQKAKEIEEVSRDLLNSASVRGYLRIEDSCEQVLPYNLLTEDFETVTDVRGNGEICRWSPPRTDHMPNVKGKTLKEAVPLVLSTFYKS